MTKFSTPPSNSPDLNDQRTPQLPEKEPVLDHKTTRNIGFEKRYKDINSDPQEALLESVESLNGLPPPPLPPKASGSIGDISSSKSTSSSKSLDQSSIRSSSIMSHP